MISFYSLAWQLFVLLDAQTTVLADLALKHYSPGPTQGPGYRHWAEARDLSLDSLHKAMIHLLELQP
jgi:hypothetical protein